MDRHKKMVNRDNVWKIKATNCGGPFSLARRLMLFNLFGETFENVSVGGHCHNPSPMSLSESRPEEDCCDTLV
jgi:hypothetical protein